jgi:bifunctional DNA-binding transcriptional regulator/antitoxin component of YhaV-PrlF toxin-antitoxin module
MPHSGDAHVKKYKFKATIQAGEGGGAFVFFPFDVEKEFGTRGKVPIKVTFDGVPDTSGLFKYGYPQHLIGVPKAIREQLGKKPGDSLEVVAWKDEAERVIEVPPAFQQVLERENLLTFFENLSYTHRKAYCRWIAEAIKEETRQKRLEKAVELMKKGIKTPN